MIFLGQGKIKKVCEWWGKDIGVVKVCEKSAGFQTDTVKITNWKVKTKSRVKLIFFSDFFYVSVAELMNSTYEQQVNKTLEKKLLSEQNKVNKVSTESLYFKLFFANLKIAYNKML